MSVTCILYFVVILSALKFGGSYFIEIQYCRLAQGTEIERIVSVDAIEAARLSGIVGLSGKGEGV